MVVLVALLSSDCADIADEAFPKTGCVSEGTTNGFEMMSRVFTSEGLGSNGTRGGEMICNGFDDDTSTFGDVCGTFFCD